MKIKTLENVGETELLEVFNTSFSDYSIAIQFEIQQWKSKIKAEAIDLKYSVGAFRKEQLVGFILHGTKEMDNYFYCYNGGTGVIPSERGNGLTVSMYEYLTPILKSKNVNRIILEVLSDNAAAIKSYNRVGFQIGRKLNCYKGEIFKRETNPEVNILLMDNPDLDLLNLIGEVKPTWQNAKEAIINRSSSIKVFGAYKIGELVGYVAVNDNNRILQIAVKKEMRRLKIGTTLLEFVRSNISKETSITNVDAACESINMFFEKSGLTNFLQQDEMNLMLK